MVDEDVFELAPFATLEDETVDEDFMAGAPLVWVMLEDTCLDNVAVDELSCFDVELFGVEDEA